MAFFQIVSMAVCSLYELHTVVTAVCSVIRCLDMTTLNNLGRTKQLLRLI